MESSNNWIKIESSSATGAGDTSYRLEDWIHTTGMPDDASGISTHLFDPTSPSSSSNIRMTPEYASSSYGYTGMSSYDATCAASSDFSRLPSSGPDEKNFSHTLDDTSNYAGQRVGDSSSSSYMDTGWDTNTSNSQPVSPSDEPSFKNITLSTAFPAVPNNSDRPPPDVVLLSSDLVVFYVDQMSLLNGSSNSFNNLLPIMTEDKTQHVCYLPDVDSAELNIMLHILYHIDCSQYNPPLSSVIPAIDRLPQYGYAPRSMINSTYPIYKFLITQSALYPLCIYCLAGKHDILELATAVSSNLLSLSLSTITDEDAERMGSMYLARLFRLHKTRVTELTNGLMPPPTMHSPTKKCSFEQQKALASAWGTAAAYISWSAKPDILTKSIRSAFDAMTIHITCKDCLKGRDERVNKIVVNWSMAKTTI